MSLKDIVGQNRALRGLASLLSSRHIPPALLFHGPRGVGKSTTALQFAKALNCEAQGQDSCDACPSCLASTKGLSSDLYRVDAAYQAGLEETDAAKQRSIKIETVRYLMQDLEMRSLAGRWKTVILEDAHSLVPAAAHALLKALEEPPQKTVWMLITHQKDRILPTIRSRCQTIPFSPLTPQILLTLLSKHGIQKDLAQWASQMAEGSLTRALDLALNPQINPTEWTADPLTPLRIADELPRELHVSRPLVERHLHRMAWHLRQKGQAVYASPRVRKALRELNSLKQALDSNADPRLVLELAVLELQETIEPLAP